MREEIFGGLTVRITGGSDRQGGVHGEGPVVVLMHGFGAPGDDLVPLWRVLDVPGNVRFVFPQAPIPLDMGWGDARAWWLIDMARIERAARGEEDAARALAEERPDGMTEARGLATAMLDEVARQLGGPIVLGGFSQGSMLAVEVALHDPRPLAGLVVMSGALVSRAEWTPRAASRAGLRVLQSHGSADPLLPLPSAEALRDLLRGAGLSVEWLPFRGGHTIPEQALVRLSALVREVAASHGKTP